MNQLDSQLMIFSWLVVAVFAAMIAIPTLQRKREVLSAWNFFLLGSLVFTGLSGINATQTPDYVSYTRSDYIAFYIGVLVLYSAAAFGYSYIRWPRRLAGKVLLSWPPVTTTSLFVLTMLISALSVLIVLQIPIPFIGQVLFQLAIHAPCIALTCGFVAWYKDKTNPLLIGLLMLILMIGPLAVLSAGSSRRYIMSLILVFPICIYWLQLRTKSMATIMLVMGLAAAVALPLMMGYSAVRHSNTSQISGIERAAMMITKLPEAIRSGGVTEGLFGQDSVEVALTTIHETYSGSGTILPSPFFAAYVIVTNPIPRSYWPEKPESLGHTLPESLGVWRRTGYVNWGVNIVGQAYFDGGLHVHLIYGLLIGMALRFFDELLIRRPGNPFVLATLCACSMQIVALSRGCIESFLLPIFAGIFTVALLTLIGILGFGVGFRYPRTDHIDDAWEAERMVTYGYWQRMLELMHPRQVDPEEEA